MKLVHKVVDFIEEGLPSSRSTKTNSTIRSAIRSTTRLLASRRECRVDVLRDIEAAGERALELLETHSQQETVDILVREFGNSAMAKQLPKGTLRKLFNTLVDEAAGMPEIPPLPRKKRGGRARR